jgi:hypothetical protein
VDCLEGRCLTILIVSCNQFYVVETCLLRFFVTEMKAADVESKSLTSGAVTDELEDLSSQTAG